MILIERKAKLQIITGEELTLFFMLSPSEKFHTLLNNWPIEKIKDLLRTSNLSDAIVHSIRSKELSLSARLFGPYGFFTSRDKNMETQKI